MGFLKLKGESVMKLLRVSLGTQHVSWLSSLDDELQLIEWSASSFMLILLSTFSAEEEFWLSPVEWSVVLLSLCLMSSPLAVMVDVLCEEICSSPNAPTKSLIS